MQSKVYSCRLYILDLDSTISIYNITLVTVKIVLQSRNCPYIDTNDQKIQSSTPGTRHQRGFIHRSEEGLPE